MSLSTIIPIIIFAGFIIFMIIKGKKVQDKLLLESRSVAPQIGFKLNEERAGMKEIPPDLLMISFAKTPLGRKHNLSQVYIHNVLERKEEGLTIYLFRYQHSSGSGARHSFTTLQTVACFVRPDAHFPCFTLRPKRSSLKHQHFLSLKETTFGQNPLFSEKNFVEGPDEAAIRKIFTMEVMASLANNQDSTIEALDDTFLFYQFDVLKQPAELAAFYTKARETFELF